MKPFRYFLALLILFAAPAWSFAADLTITAANVKPTDNESTVKRVQCGEGVTQGQPVYKDSTNGKFYKADCDAAGKDAAEGIALTPGATDGYIFVLFEGNLNIGATLTVGTIYVLSDVAGGVRPATDNGTADKVTVIGVASSSSVLAVKFFASGTAVP